MKVKKLALVLLGGTLLFASCRNDSTSVFTSEDVSSSIITTTSEYYQSSIPLISNISTNISISYPQYSSALERYINTLKVLEDYKSQIKLLYKKEAPNRNRLIDEMNRKYWEEYSELIKDTKEAIKNDLIRRQFVQEYGEIEVRYIESIDLSKIFFNRGLPRYDYGDFLNQGKKLVEDIYKKESKTDVLPRFKIYLENYKKILEVYYLYSIYVDLYSDNVYYLDELSKVASTYTEMDNDYKIIFKLLLEEDIYIEDTIYIFDLDEDEIDTLKNSETYSDTLIDLFKEEKELENKYYTLDDSLKLQELYLDLINKRKEIANELGYDSYLDYIYNKVYERDYTIEDSNSLINSIMSNITLKSYFINTKDLIIDSPVIGENDLLTALNSVEKVVPESREILKKLKTYGNYSLDCRTNKYSGSYETPISGEGDYYMFIGAKGDLRDYGSVFHEYGHYLSSVTHNINDKIYLDVAEIQSQGLEFLMSNFYSRFLSSEETKYMIRHNIVEALWTIYSASLITEFENYVYTVDDLNIDKLSSVFSSMQINYIYPLSLGNSGYTHIPHIYQQPGYYVSYLISIIPSMELWSENKLDMAIEKYNRILFNGTRNLNDTLEYSGVYSPFDVRAIDLIVSRIQQTT